MTEIAAILIWPVIGLSITSLALSLAAFVRSGSASPPTNGGEDNRRGSSA
jgi:hypothetical protein